MNDGAKVVFFNKTRRILIGKKCVFIDGGSVNLLETYNFPYNCPINS